MDISHLRDRPENTTLTVTELNNYIKNLVDSNRTLNAVTVCGEISNFTNHRSGHLYFSIKDSEAQIKAVMFRSSAARLKFMPSDGMRVTLHGSVSMYTGTGSIQLYVNTMSPDGVGALYKAYEQLKARLYEEGLFSEENKKPLPKYPRKIGVITSPSGAAVRDIINVTGRRFPLATIYIYPALVQGEGSEESLIRALDYLDGSGLCDVIIIGRGGGSIEDLWSFNSELLARRIYSAKTPIISAVGHETDFTICDFVADMRAPTPSAAAELACPDIREIRELLDNNVDKIISSLLYNLERKRDRLDRVKNKDIFVNPTSLFAQRREDTAELFDRAYSSLKERLISLSTKFKIYAGKLDALSPLSVLSRGYSVASKDGVQIDRAAPLAVGDIISVRFTDGSVDCKVENKDLGD